MTQFWSDGMELYHYGVPGQKWGQRRFQNPDGSLTAEGVRRYGRMARRYDRLAKMYERQGNFYRKHGNRSLGNASIAAVKRSKERAENWRKGDIFTSKSSATTQRVLADYRNLSNKDFFSKYKGSRREYARRVKKYGDPHVYRTTGKFLTEEARKANIEQLYKEGKNKKRY